MKPKSPRLESTGKPVLVDVTADWCVTCKYNERFVLNSYDVKRVLEKRGVIVMRADWTNHNEVIRHLSCQIRPFRHPVLCVL